MRIEELRKGIPTSSILGMPVYTLDRGRCLGSVKDVVYDSNNGRLIGVTIEEPGFFSPERRVLLFEDIQSIGRDAIMIEKRDALRRTERVPEVHRAVERRHSIKGKMLITESGNKLGSISDAYIDENSGHAVSYEVSHGVTGDIGSGRNYVSASQARTVGLDAIIVPDDVESTLEEQEPGGMKGAYQAAGARASEYKQQISEMSHEKKVELSRGKTAGYDVRDDDGRMIVAKDSVVTDEVIRTAEERGKMNQVAMATGAASASAGFGRARAGASGAYEQAGGTWEQTKQSLSEAWSNFTESFSKSADESGRRRAISAQKKFLQGKISDSDVRDDRGNLLLKSGEVITPLVLDTLDRTGKLEHVRIKPEETVSVAKVEPQLHLVMETHEQEKREQTRPHI